MIRHSFVLKSVLVVREQAGMQFTVTSKPTPSLEKSLIEGKWLLFAVYCCWLEKYRVIVSIQQVAAAGMQQRSPHGWVHGVL